MRRSVLHSVGITFSVLALGLLLTALAAVAVHREAAAVDARHLRNTATRTNAVLADGIGEYENVLLSAGSLIGSTALPTLAEWREYVATLQIDTRYPGLHGIGYIAAVPAQDIDAYIQHARQLIPDFAMRRLPDGPPNMRDYFPNTYIEPIERNQGRVASISVRR